MDDPALPTVLRQFRESLLTPRPRSGPHQDPADYSPGSPDIDLVIDLMTALSAIKVPAAPGPWKPIEIRVSTYVDDPADAALFTGQTLTHTDWMPDNVLITPAGAKLIDWAWATPADAWTDPAFWLLRLMAHGHSARQAETVASRLPAYAAADPARVDLFARANVRVWNEIEQSNHIPWTKTMAASARAWAQHRGTGNPKTPAAPPVPVVLAGQLARAFTDSARRVHAGEVARTTSWRTLEA